MAYEEMKCRKCGKPIQFAEGAPWIRCVYCGAEYTRTAKKEKAGEVQPIGNVPRCRSMHMNASPR